MNYRVANQTPAVIVFGPQGCGKSTHAERLRRAFNLGRIEDDFWPGQEVRAGILYLTHADPLAFYGSNAPCQIISLDDALKFASKRGGGSGD